MTALAEAIVDDPAPFEGSVAVFGAAGFVGRTLVQTLADANAPAISLIDREDTSESLIKAAGRRGARVDVYNSNSLRDYDYPTSTMIVLAGQTDVDQALREPAHAFDANIDIAVGAGEWLRRNSVSRMIYLSTDEVLGETLAPLDESAPRCPTQPYAASKAAAEVVLECYAQTYSLDLVIVRSCNLVGSNQRARKLLPVAVTHLMEERDVPIFGPGNHLREWLAVEDICSALRVACGRSVPSGVYNCASGYRRTTLEVVRIVAHALGKPARWRQVADRLVHDQAYGMTSGALRSYGWRPAHHPEDALRNAAVSMAKAWTNGERLFIPL